MSRNTCNCTCSGNPPFESEQVLTYNACESPYEPVMSGCGFSLSECSCQCQIPPNPLKPRKVRAREGYMQRGGRVRRPSHRGISRRPVKPGNGGGSRTCMVYNSELECTGADCEWCWQGAAEGQGYNYCADACPPAAPSYLGPMDQTGTPTAKLTRVINILKTKYSKLKNNFDNNGTIYM